MVDILTQSGYLNHLAYPAMKYPSDTLSHTEYPQVIILAQLISCAITNHYLWYDSHCQRQCWHCRQKLTSRSVAYIG